MKKEFFVVDLETTGLNGYPQDKVVEIAVCKVSPGEISIVYDSVVGYNVDEWDHWLKEAWIFHNSSLTLDEVRNAKPVEEVVKDVQFLNGKPATSFNAAFDFGKFLTYEPWDLDVEPVPCIMLSAAQVCKIPGYYGDYKWPTLAQAYRRIVHTSKNPLVRELIEQYERVGVIQAHRALGDTLMSSLVALELGLWIQEEKNDDG